MTNFTWPLLYKNVWLYLYNNVWSINKLNLLLDKILKHALNQYTNSRVIRAKSYNKKVIWIT